MEKVTVVREVIGTESNKLNVTLKVKIGANIIFEAENSIVKRSNIIERVFYSLTDFKLRDYVRYTDRSNVYEKGEFYVITNAGCKLSITQKKENIDVTEEDSAGIIAADISRVKELIRTIEELAKQNKKEILKV